MRFSLLILSVYPGTGRFYKENVYFGFSVLRYRAIKLFPGELQERPESLMNFHRGKTRVSIVVAVFRQHERG